MMETKSEVILKVLCDKSIPLSVRVCLLDVIEDNKDLDISSLMAIVVNNDIKKAEEHEQGFYGNVWIRKQYYPTQATVHKGHVHRHNHLSLVASGSVLVEVEGFKPKKYISPTFFIVDANTQHKITALEDNSTVFCIFAVRDHDGKSAEDYYSEENNPRAFSIGANVS